MIYCFFALNWNPKGTRRWISSMPKMTISVYWIVLLNKCLLNKYFWHISYFQCLRSDCIISCVLIISPLQTEAISVYALSLNWHGGCFPLRYQNCLNEHKVFERSQIRIKWEEPWEMPFDLIYPWTFGMLFQNSTH